jgi:hypothetical protein
MKRLVLLAGLVALAACNSDVPEPKAKRQAAPEPEPETVDIPQTVTRIAPGTTPMAQRVAVIGLLNKRNGIAQDLTLRPGQAVRTGDVIVRLRACETTAPWEVQKLTGAFVQLDVRNPQGQYGRVFSGWLYKETPSLNVVEHPIYDVWPKSCAMTHPAAGSAAREGAAASSRSRAPNSAASPSAPAPAPAPTPTPATPSPAPEAAPPSAPPPAPTPAPEPTANAAERIET